MSKLSIVPFVLCMLFPVAPTLTARADDAASELEQIRTRVSGLFDEIAAENVQPSPVDGWYTIQKGTIVAYISADGKYLFQGDLIDLDKEISLTEETRKAVRVKLMSGVPDKQTIVFAPDKVKYSVSVFTDIDCPYCRKFHSQIDQYLAQGIKVRYLLYPRSGPKTSSWTKAEEVWCADDRRKALTLSKLDRPFETQKCDASIVNEFYALGQEVGLTGTPALVLEDGTLISGYVPPAELAKRMAAAQ